MSPYMAYYLSQLLIEKECKLKESCTAFSIAPLSASYVL